MSFLISFLLPFIPCQARAQKADSLKQKIEQIISTKNADVGVSISGIEDLDSLSVNGNRHFPLQSVFKFHIALTVLNEVDRGRLFLNQEIQVTKTDLLPDTWSPLREKYPNGNIKISLAEILNYTVSQSDNNGCDILLRQLLKLFYERKILSEKTYDYLWKMMAETPTGKKRIKGQLPPGTLVAHKTGTSDTNDQGVTAAVNDIGIVTLPNGKHFAIGVFVSNSKENEETNEKIISDISKLAWDYFTDKTK